ncbi:AAA ATPase, central domain protein [Alkaliphilus metalliredigens QYMF]|uniref:AAA ATPase, central domain protein n=1 Tax=Alkaliphilus metalliredigens (strain QYMF) TaxID=293826 RepID=A6TR75_ALKMQ|nr:AAA family ATPase [Alkaliphilus metalliredigens]ABR48693.1 AAA ATPase, central domain protein [Alkaliphilus metalliredigens QYMF]
MNYPFNAFRKGDISSNELIRQMIVFETTSQSQSQSEKPFISKEQDIQSLDNLLEELNELIGLKKVKVLVNEMIAYTEMQQIRRNAGLQSAPLVLHMIFKGNPGTGKTTIARLLGKIFCAMGILKKGHLIEIERADLVGEYIGHTAQKVKQQVKDALGGILFIDEAYSLARGGEKDFGKEAIDALVKAMEDHKDELILILAGYMEEMDEFLQINPGLQSRFPIHIDFEDYTIEELIDISELMVEQKEYVLSKSAKAKLYSLLASKKKRDGINSGNARLVRNLIEKAIRKQAVRLRHKSIYTRDDLMILLRNDFDFTEGEN